MRVLRSLPFAAALLSLALLPGLAQASGTLTPVTSGAQPIEIRDHHVDVSVTSGFLRVEVTQTFFNPNGHDLEALYAFPVPEGAALAEMSIMSDELALNGEVVERDRARKIYEEERDAGNDTGLAEKQGYQRFEFSVSPVRARSEVQCRFAYYQRLTLDTGVARIVYPLKDGGTDEAAQAFWTSNPVVQRSFSMDLEIRSGWPVEELRMPGLDAVAQVERLGPGHLKARVDLSGGNLDRDIVAYYRLADDLPGRIEMITHRPDPHRPGTFMMVVTPGVDLAPITTGSDYVFVLDVSGSMAGKLATLAHGVGKAITHLQPHDRFRVVTFADSARELTRGWIPATPEAVAATVQKLSELTTRGGTNLYRGIFKGLEALDADRTTSFVLVTDAVANAGEISPKAFSELLRKQDVRFFGFLLGNGANWPLMRVMCDATGGFYAPVSDVDDIFGQIQLAKSKITHEALHDARLQIDGVDLFDRTNERVGKVFRGQQLVVFGRYRKPGMATLSLNAQISGHDKLYTTQVDFPAQSNEHPEIERLWALARIDEEQLRIDRGDTPQSEGEGVIAGYGVDYQLVTDHTSMIVLSDEAHARHGIDRRNATRVATEAAARVQRSTRAPQNHRVDRDQPAFGSGRAPRGSGGALDIWSLALLGVLVLMAGGAVRSARVEAALDPNSPAPGRGGS